MLLGFMTVSIKLFILTRGIGLATFQETAQILIDKSISQKITCISNITKYKYSGDQNSSRVRAEN